MRGRAVHQSETVKSMPSVRPSRALVVILLLALPAGCKKKAPNETAQQPAPPTVAPSTVAPTPPAPAAPPGAPPTLTQGAGAPDTTDGAPAWLAHPTVSPGTTVLTALDPHTMSPTEVQFGVAPKLSKDVEYKPNVIVMEQGDRAIKSIASDGLTWTFDANAPHVSEFAEGKIVFATGRAVGKVMALKKNGSTVTAVLGPVQLEDLINKGRFVMEEAVDPNKMISYVAPDYPGFNDSASTQLSSTEGTGYERRSTLLVSTASNGRWVPTPMSMRDESSRRSNAARHLPRWARRNFAAADAELAALRKKQGLLQGPPRVPTLPPLNIPPTTVTGPPPSVTAGNGDVRIENVANNSYVGVQYYYVKNDMGATAAGFVTLRAPVIRCVLTFSHGSLDSAGISIKGAAGIRLRLDGHTSVNKILNLKLTHFVPVSISIPLGGPVPVSLTFATFFNVATAFSAKSSMMVAEGEYTFSGGVWAGRAGPGWSVAFPASAQAVTSFGNTAAALSVGITSFTLGFGIRTMVGVGAFGFNTGVFATVRFGGSALASPTTAFPCRRGTIGAFIDTGVGYQLPGSFTAVLNFFLTNIGGHAIDAVGTLAKGPSTNLFNEDVSSPKDCAGAKTG
jgi:hypothetical protein